MPSRCIFCGSIPGTDPLPTVAETRVELDYCDRNVRRYLIGIQAALVSTGVWFAALVVMLAINPNHPWAILAGVLMGASVLGAALWMFANLSGDMWDVYRAQHQAAVENQRARDREADRDDNRAEIVPPTTPKMRK